MDIFLSYISSTSYSYFSSTTWKLKNFKRKTHYTMALTLSHLSFQNFLLKSELHRQGHIFPKQISHDLHEYLFQKIFMHFNVLYYIFIYESTFFQSINCIYISLNKYFLSSQTLFPCKNNYCIIPTNLN